MPLSETHTTFSSRAAEYSAENGMGAVSRGSRFRLVNASIACVLRPPKADAHRHSG